MSKLIYDVAVTVDGFIAREDGNTEGFAADGPVVEDYFARLQGYGSVVMGRKTYEYGYDYGLVPGARAYPHMEHYIFSSSLRFADDAEVAVHVLAEDPLATVRRLKDEAEADIYLCGGGALAGALLEGGLIDQLVLKRNPLLFGRGVPLFGASRRDIKLALVDSQRYDSGVVLQRYDLVY